MTAADVMVQAGQVVRIEEKYGIAPRDFAEVA